LTSPGGQGLPGAAQLLENAGWLDEMRVYHNEDISTIRGRWNLLKELRRRTFDVWIELPNDPHTLRVALRNMFFARLTGAKWARGWRINTIHWAVQAQSEGLYFPYESNRLLSIVREEGIRTDTVSFPLPLEPHHAKAVDALLREYPAEGLPLVVVAPGAKRPANRWPVERFAELGQLLVQRGFRIALLGGNSDAGICRQVAESVGSGVENLADRTSLLESCELLKRCSLVISNDSGVQHLAAAVGTPCISLFSCRDFPGKWWPYGDDNIVLRRWVTCHTCYLEICPYDNHCLRLIEPSEVLDCVERKLREGKLKVPSARLAN
jgi:ADP-heptose:LPS heptosyltransferase